MPSQTLEDASKHGELIVFFGAGASMLSSSPEWYGFSNHIVDALEKGGALSFFGACGRSKV